MAIVMNRLAIPNGEFTIEVDPVVTVTPSKIPAALADKNMEINTKIAV
ncbi:hypothetical protein GCM10022260_21790 [Gaetbulibacter aestuarii]